MYIQIKVYVILIDQNDCSTYFKGIIDPHDENSFNTDDKHKEKIYSFK